jgi:hypothetical protein
VTPREILMVFTAGWLGGLGALSALNPHASAAERMVGLAEAVAAVFWFPPRTRTFGFGAMLAVLAVAAVHHLMAGSLPGAVIFYAAVVLYLTIEEARSRQPPAA